MIGEREKRRDYEEYLGVGYHSLGEMSIQQGQKMILPFRLDMFDVGANDRICIS